MHPFAVVASSSSAAVEVVATIISYAFGLTVVAGSASVIYHDARAQDRRNDELGLPPSSSTPATWAIVVVLFWIVAVPVYLHHRFVKLPRQRAEVMLHGTHPGQANSSTAGPGWAAAGTASPSWTNPQIGRLSSSPAGWYPDPWGVAALRWWTGTDWSDRTA